MAQWVIEEVERGINGEQPSLRDEKEVDRGLSLLAESHCVEMGRTCRVEKIKKKKRSPVNDYAPI